MTANWKETELERALNTIIVACRTTEYREPLSHARIAKIAQDALARIREQAA